MEYPEFNIIFIILAILMITLSLQTKLGEKVSILVDRLTELWEGKVNPGKSAKGKKGSVKVSQPISGQNMSMTGSMPPMTSNQTAMNQALYGGSTSISQLPNDTSGQYSQSSQQLPNYNNMYQQDNTPMPGAATPGVTPGMTEGFMEPMAANSVLGGGAFGSW
jgi:hypothetical protein